MNFLVPITYKWDLGVLGLEAVRFIGQKNIDGLRQSFLKGKGILFLSEEG